jgi:hypothetical protein
MIVLALVLLIIVLVFSVAIVVSNPDVYSLSLFRVLVPVTSAGVFFTGFGAALVTIIALLLLRTGIRRTRETRRRLRTAELPKGSGAGTTSGSGSDTGSTSGSSSDTKRTSGSSAAGSDDAGAGRSDDRALDRASSPADRPADSTLDLEPGEDATTVPVDRRTAGRDVADRDEPRT